MTEKLESIIKATCTTAGVSLYDISLIKAHHSVVLCVYITKAGGVTIADCTRLTKLLNISLDEDDTLIDGPYTLEVSSPGVQRPLKLKKHYISAINELVEITHTTCEKKEKTIGILKEVNPDDISIDIHGETISISYQNIKKAKTCLIQKKT